MEWDGMGQPGSCVSEGSHHHYYSVPIIALFDENGARSSGLLEHIGVSSDSIRYPRRLTNKRDARTKGRKLVSCTT